MLSIYPLHKETKVRENWKDGREISLEKVIERGRKAQSTRKGTGASSKESFRKEREERTLRSLF